MTFPSFVAIYVRYSVPIQMNTNHYLLGLSIGDYYISQLAHRPGVSSAILVVLYCIFTTYWLQLKILCVSETCIGSQAPAIQSLRYSILSSERLIISIPFPFTVVVPHILNTLNTGR
jgi:hypothetical protein